jgi:hypothetical protein
MSDPRFMPWPAWSRADSPASLPRYVQYGAVIRLLGRSSPGVPGRGGAPVLARLARLVELFVARDIAYADEPATSLPGLQMIRPPDEVLVSPRQATCLDLAVTFAGGCLDVGIHPMVVIGSSVLIREGTKR